MILPMLFHYLMPLILSRISLLKNLGSSPMSNVVGRLENGTMVFVGRWSIGNVQKIYLWYNRFIPNPNSFDVVSRTNHCDIELDISMLLVHLDRPLQCKQSWHLTISTVIMCFTGIQQMESSINWWCAWMTKKRNYAVLGWREIMTSAQYPKQKCTFLSTSNTFASVLWPNEGVAAMTSSSNRQFNWL